jgi:hypothetical protein
MKDSLVKNLLALLAKVKGKKPIVIAVTIVVFVLGYFAVQKGYISQDIVDSFISSGQIDSIFKDKAVVDTVNTVIVDSIK